VGFDAIHTSTLARLPLPNFLSLTKRKKEKTMKSKSIGSCIVETHVVCALALCSFCVVMFVSPGVERLSAHRDERRLVGTASPMEHCSLLIVMSQTAAVPPVHFVCSSSQPYRLLHLTWVTSHTSRL
jgi:hypothetical protein